MPKISILAALSVILLMATNSPAGFAPVIAIPGQGQWRAGQGAPEATPDNGGIKFPCPFTGQDARFYWDLPVSVDLSKNATIVLDVTCSNHEALQSLGLYLKSGNGWYLWLRPLAQSGRQRLIFQMNAAATEGKPSGWNKITGVRFSCRSGAGGKMDMILHGMSAGNSAIILVKGTSSAPNDGERAVAQKATARIAKWLEDMGISHSVFDDEAVIAGKARSARIVVLPYNPQIGEREFAQLEATVRAGGKLIVFYGSNPALANLLGLKIGKYQSAEEPGQWSAFQFNRSAPNGTPRRIIQESGNIYSVFPGSESSRIIAFWQDSSGKQVSDPAWVQSDRGLWMTHILLGEDSDNKKMMLLSMLGYFEPGIWKEAAQSAVVAGARKPGKSAATSAGHKQGLPENEFRGVWNHSGMGIYPGDWNKTCAVLAEAGITAVFPNILWAGLAHFPSKYTAQSEQSRKAGDQMAQCAAAAKAAGLELHVWKVCWNLTMAPKEFTERMKKDGRIQRNAKGDPVLWLCPSNPENIALELNTIKEVVSGYNPDGIHLDYIRYLDENSCFCPGCRQRYEKWSGKPVANWPGEVFSGAQRARYRQWRCAQITDFARKVRGETKKLKARLKLSAAVYPKYPDCIDSIGQDWGLWLRENTVDFVCPMDYFPSVSAFRGALDSQLALPNSNPRIYPGIGATLDEGDLNRDVFSGQLRALRERGAGGFMLFDLSPSLSVNFLPLIGEGAR